MRTITEALQPWDGNGQWTRVDVPTVEKVQGVERFLSHLLHPQGTHFEATKDDLNFGAARLRELADRLERAAG